MELEVLGMKMTVAKQQEEIARLRLLANVSDQVNELQDNLDDHGDQIDYLNEDTDNLEELVTTRLDAQTRRIDTVQNYSQEVNKELQQLKTLVSNQAADLSELKQVNAAQEQQIQNLMGLLNALAIQVQTLTKDTNSQLDDIVSLQVDQDVRVTSLVLNSTEEDREMKQRLTEISTNLQEIRDEVNNRVIKLETELRQAIEDQMNREQMMVSDISVARTNFTQNAEYVQNIYADLQQSLLRLVNRIEMQERTMINLINETRIGLEEDRDNTIDTMPPTGPTLEDLETLRVRLSTQEVRIASLNSSVRNQLTEIEDRFNSRLVMLNSTIRTEIGRNAISSNAQGNGQTVSKFKLIIRSIDMVSCRFKTVISK